MKQIDVEQILPEVNKTYRSIYKHIFSKQGTSQDLNFCSGRWRIAKTARVMRSLFVAATAKDLYS